MIINIGAKLDLLANHFNSLSLSFKIYVGQPLKELKGSYCYFRLENNSPKLSDDTYGTHYKEALFDFVLVLDSKSTPDVVLYEMLNELSQKILTTEAFELNGFRISSIEEQNQSGVIRENERPMLLGQYKIIYKYRY